MVCPSVNQKHYPWMALLGGVVIYLTFGTIYTYGNLTPYVTSYLRVQHNDSSIRYSSTAWVFSLASISQGLFMPLSGPLHKLLGARLTCLVGCVVFSSGVLATSFTLPVSYYAVLATYGLAFGAGIGIAYPVCLSCAVKWYPKKKASVSGVIVFGLGASTLVFNMAQTALINPNNSNPNLPGVGKATEMYFSQPQILSRVPRCFFILAAIYFTLQMIGVWLISEPPERDAAASDVDERTDLLRDERENEQVPLKTINQHADQLPSASEDPDVTPLEMLRTKYYYMLFFMFFCNQVTVNFVSALYKAFGLTFINDDFFLAIIGSVSSVFNAFGRLFWGWFADQTSFRTTMLLITCTNALLLSTVYLCVYMGMAAYLIWICLIYFTLSGVFSICPAATAKLYGTKHFSANYGLVFFAAVPAGLIAATLTSTLLDLIGWFPMFCICASCYVTAAVLANFFDALTPSGQAI